MEVSVLMYAGKTSFVHTRNPRFGKHEGCVVATTSMGRSYSQSFWEYHSIRRNGIAFVKACHMLTGDWESDLA